MMADTENAEVLERRNSYAELTLPISRVRTIMKSSPDVENITQDALFAVTAATELFIKELTRKVYMSKGSELSDLDYKDLAAFINNEEQYKGFLDEIIPPKVLGRDILAEREANQVKFAAAEETGESEEVDMEEEEEAAPDDDDEET